MTEIFSQNDLEIVVQLLKSDAIFKLEHFPIIRYAYKRVERLREPILFLLNRSSTRIGLAFHLYAGLDFMLYMMNQKDISDCIDLLEFVSDEEKVIIIEHFVIKQSFHNLNLLKKIWGSERFYSLLKNINCRFLAYLDIDALETIQIFRTLHLDYDKWKTIIIEENKQFKIEMDKMKNMFDGENISNGSDLDDSNSESS